MTTEAIISIMALAFLLGAALLKLLTII